MDDIIYLILLAAWVAFAFYRKSQKNKKESLPRKVPQQPESAGPTIGDLIFGDKWHEDEEPVPMPREGARPVVATVRHPDSQEGISLETSVPAYQTGMRPKEREVQKETEHKEGMEEDDRSFFNLRNAVVYDAILNRPYT